MIQHASPKLDLNHFPGTIEDLVAWSNVENAPASKAPLARKRVDAGDGLNVRAEPRLDGPKVATLANGSEIDVFEEGEWDYIKAGDTVGYVFSQLLSPF